MLRLLIAFICLSFSYSSVIAQDSIKTKPIKHAEIFLGYSINSYGGDLSGFGKLNSAFNVGVLFNNRKRISGEINIRIGRVIAESLNERSPIESFVSNNYFSINYGANIRLYQWKQQLSFHLTPGFGIINHNPRDVDNNELISIGSTRNRDEEYGRIAIILPVKFGIKYHTPYRLHFGIEFGFLNTRTDYLDNVSQLIDDSNRDNIFFTNFIISTDLRKKDNNKKL